MSISLEIDSTRNMRAIEENFSKCLVDVGVVVKLEPFVVERLREERIPEKKGKEKNFVSSRKVQMSTKLYGRDEVGN